VPHNSCRTVKYERIRVIDYKIIYICCFFWSIQIENQLDYIFQPNQLRSFLYHFSLTRKILFNCILPYFFFQLFE